MSRAPTSQEREDERSDGFIEYPEDAQNFRDLAKLMRRKGGIESVKRAIELTEEIDRARSVTKWTLGAMIAIAGTMITVGGAWSAFKATVGSYFGIGK